MAMVGRFKIVDSKNAVSAPTNIVEKMRLDPAQWRNG